MRTAPHHRATAPSGAILLLLALVALGSSATPALGQLSDADHLQAVMNQMLETERSGVEIPWSNDDTGSSGTIVIERTFYLDPNSPCRDYRRTEVQPGGPTMLIRGTGCRVGENDWTLDERPPVRDLAAPAPGGPVDPDPEPSAAAPSCPPVNLPSVVRVPCTKPVPFADYTMPSKAEL